jgi:hypothetical protein
MRIELAVATIAAVTMIAALGSPTIEASCAGAAQISTSGSGGQSHIWTAGAFTPTYYPGYPPYGDGWAGQLPLSSVDNPAILETEPGPDCDDDAEAVYPDALQVCDGVNTRFAPPRKDFLLPRI